MLLLPEMWACPFDTDSTEGFPACIVQLFPSDAVPHPPTMLRPTKLSVASGVPEAVGMPPGFWLGDGDGLGLGDGLG
ncbi:MAG TPA: hypothetical protein VKX24_04315, partial [Acidimicrobiia bacterium]|nr:hypothetical protein [Acidimicrobiia bacterium]